jgi:transposase InsO family protein
MLTDHGVEISMEGRGRCHDNIFVERLWWTVKHECVYLRPGGQRPSRCCEFADSRRRFPPDPEAWSPLTRWEKRDAFLPPCPSVGGCPQASQHNRNSTV